MFKIVAISIINIILDSVQIAFVLLRHVLVILAFIEGRLDYYALGAFCQPEQSFGSILSA